MYICIYLHIYTYVYIYIYNSNTWRIWCGPAVYFSFLALSTNPTVSTLLLSRYSYNSFANILALWRMHRSVLQM